jgi:hypothetical protein
MENRSENIEQKGGDRIPGEKSTEFSRLNHPLPEECLRSVDDCSQVGWQFHNLRTFLTVRNLSPKSKNLFLHFSGDPTHRDRILRETISLLANFCHFSLAACVEVNLVAVSFTNFFPCKIHLQLNSSNLTPLFLRILESGDQTDNSIKANILRLLGNLANQKETSSIITSNASNLLDRIASTIIHEDSLMAERALRVIRLLARRPKANAKVCSVYTSKKVESE